MWAAHRVHRAIRQRWLGQSFHQRRSVYSVPQIQVLEDFAPFATATHRHGLTLIQHCIGLQDPDKIVHACDEISDTLCRALDFAEFVRSTHADSAWRTAAVDMYGELFELVNTINGEPRIYNQLLIAIQSGKLSVEAQRVAELLKLEFETDGIALGGQERQHVADLKSLAERAAHFFAKNITESYPVLDLPCTSAQRSTLPAEAVARLPAQPSSASTLRVSVDSALYASIMTNCSDDSLRKAYNTAMQTYLSENLPILSALLVARADLAEAVGTSSYLHHLTATRDLSSPESICETLACMVEELQPIMAAEIDQMKELKAKETGGRVEDATIFSWDSQRYSAMLRRQCIHHTEQEVAQYFPLGRVLDGFQALLSSTFGVNLTAVDVPNDQVGSDGMVLQFDATHEKSGRQLGTLYMDLFARQGKITNAAMFTIRCSRDLNDVEVAEVLKHGAVYPQRPKDPRHLPADGVGHCNGRPGYRQLPVVALSASYDPRGVDRSSLLSTTLLSPLQLETLFHEMGHVLHSLLCETRFQHISGVRVSGDFVEVPSNLMERFVLDKRVLTLLAGHHRTGDKPEDGVLTSVINHLKAYKAVNAGSQLVSAFTDVAFHSLPGTSVRNQNESSELSEASLDVLRNPQNLPRIPGLNRDELNTTAAVRFIEAAIGVPPVPQESCWQAGFGHFNHYGGNYYSYMLAEGYAAAMWDTLFEADPMDGAKGQHCVQELFRVGNAVPADVVLRNLLGDTLSPRAIAKSYARNYLPIEQK